MPELMNPNQEAFCQRIKGNMEMRQAYMEAFGCTKKTAGPGATRLMKRPGVPERILELRRELGAKVDFGEVEAFNDLLKVWNFDPSTFFYDDGRMKDITQMPDFVSKMISSIDVQMVRSRNKDTGKVTEEVSVVKIKFLDKMRAMEMICRMLGVFDRSMLGQQQKLAIERIVLPPKKKLGAPVTEVGNSSKTGSGISIIEEIKS